MIVMTCSLSNSGITVELEPIGPVHYSIHDCKFGETFLNKVNEELGKTYPSAAFIFNAKFEFTYCGHPSYGDFNCRITGDAYKLVEQESKQLASEKHYLKKMTSQQYEAFKNDPNNFKKSIK